MVTGGGTEKHAHRGGGNRVIHWRGVIMNAEEALPFLSLS